MIFHLICAPGLLLLLLEMLPVERAASESDLARQFRLADAKMPFPEEVLCHANLCCLLQRWGWDGGGKEEGEEGQRAKAAWATYKQTSGLFLQHIVVEGGGRALTVSGAPLMFCVNLGEHCFSGADLI